MCCSAKTMPTSQYQLMHGSSAKTSAIEIVCESDPSEVSSDILACDLEGDTEYRGAEYAEYRGKTAVRGSEIAVCGSESRFWIFS